MKIVSSFKKVYRSVIMWDWQVGLG